MKENLSVAKAKKVADKYGHISVGQLETLDRIAELLMEARCAPAEIAASYLASVPHTREASAAIKDHLGNAVHAIFLDLRTLRTPSAQRIKLAEMIIDLDELIAREEIDDSGHKYIMTSHEIARTCQPSSKALFDQYALAFMRANHRFAAQAPK